MEKDTLHPATLVTFLLFIVIAVWVACDSWDRIHSHKVPNTPEQQQRVIDDDQYNRREP